MSTEALKLAREALYWLLQDTQHAHHECGDTDRCPVHRAREALAALDSLPQAEPAELGPLPEPYARVIAYTGRYSTGGYCAEVQADSVRAIQERLYTADQMRAYAAAATARLRAELEALRKSPPITCQTFGPDVRVPCGECNQTLVDVQELDGLRKNDARYRWLCANNFDRDGATQVHTWLHTWEPHSQTGEPTEWVQRIRGSALDAAIDAAMSTTPQEPT